MLKHGSGRLVATNADHIDVIGVNVFNHGVHAFHAAFHARFGKGIHNDASENFVFFGPLEKRPDDFVNQRFWNHHLTHEKNDLVTSFNGALRLPCVGTDRRQRHTLLNQRQCRQSVVHQASDKFQIEVVDEVMSDNA